MLTYIDMLSIERTTCVCKKNKNDPRFRLDYLLEAVIIDPKLVGKTVLVGYEYKRLNQNSARALHVLYKFQVQKAGQRTTWVQKEVIDSGEAISTVLI